MRNLRPAPRRSGAAALAAALLLSPVHAPNAHAQPPKTARDAAQLFQQGKYQEAAELYAKLRDEQKNPRLSCNLGLCYWKMGYLEPAIETVRQCLDTAQLSPEGRTEYENFLARLEAQRTPQASPAGAAAAGAGVDLVPTDPAAAYPGAPPVWAPGAPVPGAEGAAGAPYPDPNQPPVGYEAYPGGGWNAPPGQGAAGPGPGVADTKETGKRRIPFGSYVTGAVGIVSTGMGIALLLHGHAIQQELDGSLQSPADRALLQSDLSRTKNGSVAAFVIGGLGLGASVVWALVAPSYVKPELAGKRLDVAVGPGSIGVSGAF